MVNFTVVYQGGLRCEAVHGPSATTLVTDAPKDNQGQGASFSPTDLTATALATCICTTMAIQTRADGIVLDGIRAEVEKHMTSTPPRRIARLVVKLDMPAGIPLLSRIKLERIAHACPVALSLHPEVVQEIGFNYPD
jgi:putative redox protein